MQREISFRAKAFESDKWVYWTVVEEAPLIKVETIGQFCNFEDMKMKKIFEGDLIETPDGIFPVRWAVDGWMTDSPEPKYLGEIDATVVGNIHEHTKES